MYIALVVLIRILHILDVVLDDAIDLPTSANDLKSGFVSDVTTWVVLITKLWLLCISL